MAHPIPFIYRVALLVVEPILALSGAFLIVFTPVTFIDSVSPRAVSSPTLLNSLAELRVLTDQLGALLLLFALNLAVVLRSTRDPAVWRAACAAMLVSDALHTAASVRELGWDVATNPGLWRSQDFVNFGVLLGMGAVRLGVVLGVGVGETEGKAAKQQ